MPATDSNRKTLEEFIKEHYKSSAFNSCKIQRLPVTSRPPMTIHTPDDAVRTYCRKATKIPLQEQESRLDDVLNIKAPEVKNSR